MGLPLVTTAANLHADRLLREKQDIVRTMGGVAACALAFFYWFT